MTGLEVIGVATTWGLDPPVICDSDPGWSSSQRTGKVEIHHIVREVHRGERVHWAFKGVLLTKAGLQRGRLDWRQVSAADAERLVAMVGE